MKKNKIKYIVLLIIATVILIADLVVLTVSGRAMSAMPGGNMGFSQNGEMFHMPGGFGEGEMPEGFDPENMPGNRGQNIASIISKVRMGCIVIAILCALTDIFCIIKIIKLTKEERRNPEGKWECSRNQPWFYRSCVPYGRCACRRGSYFRRKHALYHFLQDYSCSAEYAWHGSGFLLVPGRNPLHRL